MTKSTKISKVQAMQELNALRSEQKRLEAIINEQPSSIISRIKTLDDAIAEYETILGPVPKELMDLLKYRGDNDRIAAASGLAQMDLITTVFNEGWEPDWDNHNEWKYYPLFKHSGSGLSCDDCGSDDSRSGVGSRLCYKSRELAEYAGKQFIDIYRKFHKK